jgi:WhiB family redox-sensing transcriptional regulator
MRFPGVSLTLLGLPAAWTEECRVPREPQVAITDWSPTPWLSQARCANEDPDLFFPVGSTGPFLEQIRRAKAICWLCPVKDECLEWALATDQRAGIWGGLTEEERRDLRRPGVRREIAF